MNFTQGQLVTTQVGTTQHVGKVLYSRVLPCGTTVVVADWKAGTDYGKNVPVCQFGVAQVKVKLAEPQPVRLLTCPGCSGQGVLTDDPQVLRCQGCGGVFTDPTMPITEAQALQFVALHLPMVLGGEAKFGRDTFYFDLDIYVEPRTMVGDYRRLHGWADRSSKRVVQWG